MATPVELSTRVDASKTAAPSVSIEVFDYDKDGQQIEGSGRKVKYAIASSRDLGMSSQAKLNRLATRLGSLDETITDDEADALQHDLRWAMSELLIGCPEAVHSRLVDEDRMSVVKLFGDAALAKRETKVKTTSKKTS